MKTLAAVLHERGLPAPSAQSKPLVIEELDLDPPGEGEVLIEMTAAGLCHSDLSVINGPASGLCRSSSVTKPAAPCGNWARASKT